MITLNEKFGIILTKEKITTVSRKNDSVAGWKKSEPLSSKMKRFSFLRKYGFDDTNISALEQALLLVLETNDVEEAVGSPYGRNYVVNGIIQTPNGMTIRIVTIWFMKINTKEPRFVTAYPV